MRFEELIYWDFAGDAECCSEFCFYTKLAISAGVLCVYWCDEQLGGWSHASSAGITFGICP